MIGKSLLVLLAVGILGLLPSCAPTDVGEPSHFGASGASEGAGASGGSGAQPHSKSGILTPKHRSGLATGWGEEVRDQVTSRAFDRATTKPKGVAMIRYNDTAGVKAMLGKGRRWTTPGMQRAADGLLEWGIKSGRSTLKSHQTWNNRKERLIRAKKGKTYSIVVKNLCHSSLEVVLSVDGLDVLDGEPASTKKRGYLISPGDTLEVKGFRTSLEAVAAFKFSTVGASYTNQKHGKTRNVGVIGVAVYTQKGIDPWTRRPNEVERRESARAFAEAP